MAIAYVRDSGKQSTGGSTGSTFAFNLSANASVRNYLIITISGYSDDGAFNLTSITDNQGGSNTYSVAKALTNSIGGAARPLIYYCKVAASSGTHTITLNHSVATHNYVECCASEISGLAA